MIGVVFAQRHCDPTSHPTDLYHLPEATRGYVTRVFRCIAEVDYFLAIYYSIQWGAIGVRSERTTLPDPINKPRLAARSTNMETLAIPCSESAKGCLT